METYRRVAVWPWPLRVMHWVNAVSVLILLPLGLLILAGEGLFNIPEDGIDRVVAMHASVGLVFASGALARIIYLFTGPAHAAWRDVVPHTRRQMRLALATLQNYLSGMRGRPPLYLSHNPLAGVFDTVLFFVFVTQAASGMTMSLGHAGIAFAHEAAPRAGGPPEWLEMVHLAGASYIAFFVLAHLAALVAHDLRERRGLISSMVSGEKFFTEDEVRELGAGERRKGPEPGQPE